MDGIYKETVEDAEKVQELQWYQQMVKGFADFVSLGAGLRPLCLSVGTGLLPRTLAKSASGVVAIDPSAEMLDRARVLARKKRMRNMEFRTGSVEQIPAKDGEFDVCLGIASVYLLEDPLAGVMEMSRVTVAGGVVAILDPSHEMRLERLRSYAARTGATGLAFKSMHNWLASAQSHNQFAAMDLERLLRKSGMVDIKIEEQMDRMVLIAKGRKAGAG